METAEYFLLHLYSFSFERSVFFESFQNTDPSLLRLNVKNKITSLIILIEMLFLRKSYLLKRGHFEKPVTV